MNLTELFTALPAWERSGLTVLLGLMRVHDIEISPLLASAGIAGVAPGLAAKETLARAHVSVAGEAFGID